MGLELIKTQSIKQIKTGLYYLLYKWPFIWPLNARLGDGFGYFAWRQGRPHLGIDIGDWDDYRKTVVCTGKGTVVYAGLSGDYGNLVVVRHGNNAGFIIESRYAHLKEIKVKKWQEIAKGGTIGKVGGWPMEYGAGRSTAPHLHFEIGLRKLLAFNLVGAYVAVDPKPLLEAQ